MTSLKHLSLICTILILAAISILPEGHCRVQPNDAELISYICGKTPKPDVCVNHLILDPRSATADAKGLALIMVDAIKTEADDTLDKIQQLLKGGGENKALSSCASKYKSILEGDVPRATQALNSGNLKFADEATSETAVQANSCEQGFSGKSPLTEENNSMRDVADVTTAIVRLLH